MTEYIILFDKKYPYSLIQYLLKKSNNTKSGLTEKYLDEMKQVIKDNFYKGATEGILFTFNPDIIPVWRDLAKEKGYILTNIKHNIDSDIYQVEIRKLEQRKSKKTKIKSRR